jgi:NAD(P)-dependent dehydrogenase (short-subunit alcohol dehydrogenase family)
LSDKVAIITAGGGGIGAAAARRLASDGFRVAIFDTSDKAEALAKELGGFAVTGSNQSNDDLKRLVEETMARWNRIDVLLNGAGHFPNGRRNDRLRRHASRRFRQGLLPTADGTYRRAAR